MCFKDKLKSAICNNDIEFLNQNREKYSIDDRLNDEDDDTLLLYSISDSKSCVYEYFLKNNADVYLLNNEGENILHAIVYSGDSRRLEKVMDNYKIDIDFQANDGSTPLLLAISLEHFKMADLLIKYGVNVNIADVDGITPLHLAVQFGHLSFVDILIKKGANINAKTVKDNLPLALAVNAGNDGIVKYIYQKIYG